MIIYDKEQEVFYSEKINDDTYYSAFGTKKLKASDDYESIIEFCTVNKFTQRLIYRPNQIHSRKVIILNEADEARVEEADGVVTKNTHVVAAVRTADCVPIIFVDKEAGVIGISHQGWKGTVSNMVSEMISSMVLEGARKESIIAAIGPCIGLCCFEVKEDVYAEFRNKLTDIFTEISLEKNNKKFLNLLKTNYLLLLKAGLKKTNIDFFPFCTFCDKERFFSYRRDYFTNYTAFGQQFSFILKHD